MCLAETTTAAPKNDSLNGLPSFALTFFPCTLCAVRVMCLARNACVCAVPVLGVWRVCSVCLCMACVHVCACAWRVWLSACVLVCLCGVRDFFSFQFQLLMISMNTHLQIIENKKLST
jgi:hypothetical protein